ncbi:MAG: NosD domain-containing protein, partial [Thermoplasmata archaeon]
MCKMMERLRIVSIVWAILLSGLIVIVPLPNQVEAGTLITGDITTNTTWTLSGSPYWIDGQIKVLEGVTLTIEPGVEVKFVPRYPFAGSSLYVYGCISAVGDSSNHIVLTSNSSDPQPGDWDVILILGHAQLEYADVFYGNMGVVLATGNNTVFESTISHNRYHGLLISSWGRETNEIRNSTIVHNGLSGIFANMTGSATLIENSTISNNKRSGLSIYTGRAGHFIIRNNVISFNQHHGMDLSFDTRFDITCNGVFANDKHGIRLSFHTSNASIHHNNVISNVIQASDDGNSSIWDDGSEGNYWSDYEGNDTDGDGIGDEPYVIDEDSQDNFPFMDPVNYCPLPTQNMPPLAVAKPDYQFAEEGSVALFYGNESYDWDGTIVNYTWDF